MIQFTPEHIVAIICASNITVLLVLYWLYSKNSKAMNERFEAQLLAIQESQTAQQYQGESLGAQLNEVKAFSQSIKAELSQLLSALQSSVQSSSDDTKSQVASHAQRLQGSISQLEAVLLGTLSDNASAHASQLQAESNKLADQIDAQTAKVTEQQQQAAAASRKADSQLNSKLDSNLAENMSAFDDQAKAAAALMGKLNNLEKDIKENHKVALNSTKVQGSELASTVAKGNNELHAAIQSNGHDNRSAKFELRQQQLSEFARLAEMVQQIRVSNMAALTNELAKHQELTLESDDAIKYLGECKVTRIEDKHTNQVTKIAYHQGKQSKLETFENNKLKYEMTFDERQSPKVGTEYDESGREIFSYHYNAAGEISQRIEYTYTNGKQQSQTITL